MKRLLLCLLVGCGPSQVQSPGPAPFPSRAATASPDPAVAPAEPTAPEAVEAPAPAAKPEGPAAAPPPAKLAAPLERRLFPHKFSASSHLQNDWNKFQENYLADYLGDDNPATSWTEGKPDVGLGETVTIEHTPLEDATRLRLEVRNGYQKSDRLFSRNARAKGITIKLLPSGRTSTHKLADSKGWQSLTVEQPQGPLSGYEIRFDSVYKGTHYADLVISDIQTYVTALTADNPTFEAGKQQRLLGWVEGRRLAATTFKQAAKGSIPVAPTYQATPGAASQQQGEECFDDCPLPFDRASQKWSEDKARLAALRRAAVSRFKDWKQLRISVGDPRRVPQADAFTFPGSWSSTTLFEIGDEPTIVLPAPGQLAYFFSQGLKRVYIEKAPVSAAAVLEAKEPACKRESGDTHFFFTATEAGPLTDLLIITCGLYEEREGYSAGVYWQLLAYGPDGHLEYLFDDHSAYAFAWTTRDGAPFLDKVARISTAGAPDTDFLAK